MRTVGIIMECNPFHEGHQYIIERGKELSEGGAVIVVMSGDFVQRGIPAVQPKEVRVREVLNAGADMVLELPVRYAAASAESFASGAVNTLNSAGIVTDLVFGSESGDLEKLRSHAEFLLREPDEYRTLLRRKLSKGLPFPAARAAAAAECPQHIQLPDTPNDLLGEEYLKALLRSGSRITPHAVKRIPARTASEIRHEMQDKGTGIFADDFSGLLLEKLFTLAVFAGSAASSAAQSFPSDTAESFSLEGTNPASGLSLRSYAGVTPELANRITSLLPRFISWTQFCSLVKTRNITYTAVSRALLHILLEIMDSEGSAAGTSNGRFNSQSNGQSGGAVSPHYIRILGARRSALSLIAGMKAANPDLSIVTDHASYEKALQRGMPQNFRRSLVQDFRTSELYDLTARMKSGIEKAGTAVPAISEFSKQLIIL